MAAGLAAGSQIHDPAEARKATRTATTEAVIEADNKETMAKALVPIEAVEMESQSVVDQLDVINGVIQTHPEIFTVDPLDPTKGRLELSASSPLGTTVYEVRGDLEVEDGSTRFAKTGDIEMKKSVPGSSTGVAIQDGRISAVARGMDGVYVTATIMPSGDASQLQIDMRRVEGSGTDNTDTLPRDANAVLDSLHNGIAGFGYDIQDLIANPANS